MSCICGSLTLSDLVDDIGEEIYLSSWDQEEPLFILRPKKHQLEKVSNLFVTKELFKLADIHQVKVKKGKYYLDFKNKKNLVKVRISTQLSSRSNKHPTYEASITYYKRRLFCITKKASWDNLKAFTWKDKSSFISDPISIGF